MPHNSGGGSVHLLRDETRTYAGTYCWLGPRVVPMSAEMALDIWKWRPSWTSSISSSPVGNDFRQPRGNESFRHFHMSTISTPYGGPAYAERRRPAQDRRG